LAYFNTKQLAAISMSAALWAILNVLVAPAFWNLTHLPILCDLIGVSLFILTAWWAGKLGSVALMGGVTTVLNLTLQPGSFHFLGFTVASIVFDAGLYFAGYDKAFGKGIKTWVITLGLSLVSTLIAGILIGSLFMAPAFLVNTYGGVAFFAALHGVGGLCGGALGMIIVEGVSRRGISGVKST